MPHVPALVVLSVLAVLPPAAAAADTGPPPVWLSCAGEGPPQVIGGLRLPHTFHLQGRGATVDEAEARLKSGGTAAEDGAAFTACTRFSGQWRPPAGRPLRVDGDSLDGVIDALVGAGAPAGAVSRWKREQR